KSAAKIVVYKFGSDDVCEGADSYENFVVSDTRDDETAAKIVYKFGSDELEGGGSGNLGKKKTQKKRKRDETRRQRGPSFVRSINYNDKSPHPTQKLYPSAKLVRSYGLNRN
ncbi:hypothetical protein L195_g048793, partial [Trifolium pratense]